MLALIVQSVIEETSDARTYIVGRADKENIIYKAGQFITITVNLNGRELRRSYSLCTAPEFDSYVAFTVKKVANGEVSRHLFRNLVTGSTLLALEPSGRFTFQAEGSPKRDVFLIAAGSGVTPVISLLKKMVKTAPGCAIKLVLQNRNEHTAIFNDEFHLIASAHSEQVRFFNFLSDPVDKHKPSRRLNNELLEDMINDELSFNRNDALFYICGPLSFMRMAEFTIRQMGFLSEQVRKEIFELPRVPPAPFSIDDSPRNMFIKLGKDTVRVPVRFPETLLEAALTHHINIPFSCKAGICGTCVLRCTDGKVKMKYNDVLTDGEVEDGLVLTCVGYALSDITLTLSH
jgi:ring-1,2-phenylacetyl-CoA epoxidase subunit PaaE